MAYLPDILRGVRILDLSQYIPGPLATLVLADMGAEVLKIEPPGGDQMRALGPKTAEGEPIYFAALNAGKVSMSVDLKSANGKGQFLQLVRTADVLVESFRPGVMERLGLDFDTLRTLNPGLVYCSISGYGSGGAMAHTAGHDAQYLALAGVLYRNGMGSGPQFFDPPVADGVGSLWAALAILGAIHARTRDGKGCHLDIALADAIMPLQGIAVAALSHEASSPQPGSTYLNGGAAYYNVYATSDGRHVALGAVELKFWNAFCLAAGRLDWVSRHSDTIPQNALKNEISRYFVGLTLDQATTLFGSADCCFSPILDLREACDSPYHSERGILVRAEDGTIQTLTPALFNNERLSPRPPLRKTSINDFLSAPWKK